jgi:hypothetical protein
MYGVRPTCGVRPMCAASHVRRASDELTLVAR